MLVTSGMTVLISNYFEYYRLAAYLRRYTKSKVGATMGIASLRELFTRNTTPNSTAAFSSLLVDSSKTASSSTSTR